jgi:hypothetical protein
MYFVSMHENRAMKPVEIVLRKGKWNEGEIERVNPFKITF